MAGGVYGEAADTMHQMEFPIERHRGAKESSTMRRTNVKQVMVRYKVKAAESERNEELVRQVYAELHRTNPEGLRYATFVLEDGVSFVHIASFDDDARNPLSEVAAFRAFQETIGDRVDEPPRVESVREIGSYGMFAGERAAGTRQ